MQNNMMFFHLQQQAKKFESQCYSNEVRLASVKTMREVKFLLNLNASPEVRFMPEIRQSKQRLTHKAAIKMEQLLGEQLAQLGALSDMDELKKQLGQHKQLDWCYLRGDFPALCVKSDREVHKLLHKLQRSADSLEITKCSAGSELGQEGGAVSQTIVTNNDLAKPDDFSL